MTRSTTAEPGDTLLRVSPNRRPGGTASSAVDGDGGRRATEPTAGPRPAAAAERNAPEPTPAPVAPSASLSLLAKELLERLPAGQLEQTAAGYPHVVDTIARAWASPTKMHATLDALVFDERGGRAGFPLAVMAELGELRACYERWVGPRTMRGR